MLAAWNKIVDLIRLNATHRAGWKLGEVSPLHELKSAAQEMIELADNPRDINEMADVIGCLLGYCIMSGWTMQQLETAILDKLEDRFFSEVV